MPAGTACLWRLGSNAAAFSTDSRTTIARSPKTSSLAYPKERQSVLALLSAGRLSLKPLNRPGEALRFYNAAKASPVPHLDWEANIAAGIQAAEKAAGIPDGPA